jgi:nitrogen fixation/metabolism regulation signal transduction histidine kinase
MLQHFYSQVVIRVIIILALMSGMLFLIQAKSYSLAVFLAIGLVSSVYQLIRYVNHTNRELANFFSAIKYDDYTLNTYSGRKGKSFEILQDTLKLISKKFRDIRAEKEANHQFLQTIIHHVEVGLLCVKEDGEVILMNEALQNLLHKSYLINFEGLKKINPQLWEKVNALQPGAPELIKVNIQNKLLQLSIQAVDIKLQDVSFRLYTFQNIQNELEAKELDAWQKLIRILTHEIMNSVAPISSLSSTLKDMLANPSLSQEEKLEHAQKSMQVIQKRSEGLLDFTETYRTLTRIPPPKFQRLDLVQLAGQVITLMESDFQKFEIELQKDLPHAPLLFDGDPHLLEQVFINLLKNAVDAVREVPQPIVKLSVSRTPAGKVSLEIADNGPGISEEMLDQVFVPFFTTKEEGSGIGLSLSRQIIRTHKGQIEMQSAEGEGTLVKITL